MPSSVRDPSQARLSFPHPTEESQVVVRSDGRTYRLEAGDRLIMFPAQGTSNAGGLSSIGFWYAHGRNGFSTESVVVLLRCFRSDHPDDVRRQVDLVADELAERLAKDVRLPALLEFDGLNLVTRV